MAKRQGEREGRKKKSSEEICDLDNGYVSPVQTFRDLTIDNITSVLVHSRYIQLLLGLTIIGGFLRFFNLGFNSLWLDEASTYTFASMSLPGIWEATTGGEFNPPLFYWIEHVMLAFGNNEVVLRFMPALFGILTIPLIYWVGKEFMDRNVGIIAAAACTFSPFLIMYSQEARAYSMGLFFIAFAMVFFLKALKTNNAIHWALFGILSAFAYWTHFYTLVITGTLVLYAIFEKVMEWRKDIQSFKPVIIGAAAFVIISLPLLMLTVQLFSRRTSGGPTFGIQGVGIIIETFRQLSGFSELVMVLFLILFAAGIIQALLLDRNKGIFLLALTILPFVISWFLSYKIPMVPRYLIILAPVYFIGIALSYKPLVAMISNRKIIYGVMALLVVLSVTTPFFAGYYTSYTKEDWRGFAGQISQVTQSGDSIVLVPSYIRQPFNYYYNNNTDGTFEYFASNADQLNAIAALKDNGTIYYIVTGDISSEDPSGGAVAWLQDHTNGVEVTPGIYLLKAA
jgi:4-amino-4-deoxy-L-arabinose transferase-like glycosyltransferase